MTEFTKEVIEIIKSIPSGKVMSYGQIARMAGNPRAARQVSRILHSMTQKYDLPWHRVVNKDGKIAIKKENIAQVQIQLLEEEGVEFNHLYQIDMDIFAFDKKGLF